VTQKAPRCQVVEVIYPVIGCIWWQCSTDKRSHSLILQLAGATFITGHLKASRMVLGKRMKQAGLLNRSMQPCRPVPGGTPGVGRPVGAAGAFGLACDGIEPRPDRVCHRPDGSPGGDAGLAV